MQKGAAAEPGLKPSEGPPCSVSLYVSDVSTASSGEAHVNVAHTEEPGRMKRLLQRLTWPAPYVWISVLVFVVIQTLGIIGALAFAKSVERENREQAEDIAITAAGAINNLLQAQIAPMMSLANHITVNPHWPTLQREFQAVAQAIYNTNPFFLLEACPYGVVGLMSTPWVNLKGQALEDFWHTMSLGLDILQPSRPASDREAAFQSIRMHQDGHTVLLGPWYEDSGQLQSGAFVVRTSIFLPSGDWQMPNSSIATCPPDACQRGNLTWWGWSAAIFPWTNLAAGLEPLKEHKLLYSLYPGPAPLGSFLTEKYLANTTRVPGNRSVVVDIDVYGSTTWTLRVEPENGFEPEWLAGLLVGVTALSLLLSGLLFGMLRSQHIHRRMVRMLLPDVAIKQLHKGKQYAEEFSDVTILFSDIVEYTNMSSEMRPHEIVELLNAMFTHFDMLTEKHGLYKVETIGDAFMCVGGAPKRRDPADAAARVARMALDMIAFTENYVHKDGRKIKIRVGMYTGDVVAAVIGQKMPHWCLVGDSVNTASRMESNSKPMQVHVGYSTARLLVNNPEFAMTARGTIQVKGKGEMQTFFLKRADPNNPQPPINLAGMSHCHPGPLRSTSQVFDAVSIRVNSTTSALTHATAPTNCYTSNLSNQHGGGGTSGASLAASPCAVAPPSPPVPSLPSMLQGFKSRLSFAGGVSGGPPSILSFISRPSRQGNEQGPSSASQHPTDVTLALEMLPRTESCIGSGSMRGLPLSPCPSHTRAAAAAAAAAACSASASPRAVNRGGSFNNVAAAARPGSMPPVSSSLGPASAPLMEGVTAEALAFRSPTNRPASPYTPQSPQLGSPGPGSGPSRASRESGAKGGLATRLSQPSPRE